MDHLRWLNDLHHFVENNIEDPLPRDTVRRLAGLQERLRTGDARLLVFTARAHRLEAIHLQNEYRWDESRDVLLGSVEELENSKTLSPVEAYELGYHYNLLALAGMEVLRPEEALLYGERALATNLQYGYTSEALKDLVNLGLTQYMTGQPPRQNELFERARQLVSQSVNCLQSINDSSAVASVEYNNARQSYMRARKRLYAGAAREADELALSAANQWKTADSLLRTFGMAEEPAYRLVMSELATSLAADFTTVARLEPVLVDSAVAWARSFALPDQHPAWIFLHQISVNGAMARAQIRGACSSAAEARAVANARSYVKTIVPENIPVSFRRGSLLLRRRIALLDRLCGELTGDLTRLSEARSAAEAVMNDYESFVLNRGTEAQLELTAGDFYGFYSDILGAMGLPGGRSDPEALLLSDQTKSLTLRLAFEKRKSQFANPTVRQRRLLDRERELAAAVRAARMHEPPRQLSLANEAYEDFLDSLKGLGHQADRRLYHDFRSLEPLSVVDVQRKLLTPERSAIDLFYGKGQIIVHAVAQKEWTQFTVPVTEALLHALEYPYSSEVAGAQAMQEAYRIYADLLEAPLTWLADRGGAETIIVATDHRLPALDFGVLPAAPPRRDAGWSGQHLLYDNHNIIHTYSLSSLMASQELASVRTEPPRRWGVFSATAGQTRPGRSDTPALPRLGAAVRYVSSTYHDDPTDHTVTQAGRQDILEKADRYRYLMLVSHGYNDEFLPERYYLQFAESDHAGMLTTFDLYNLSLRADLTLALNCESAEGDARTFAGKKSIARALSYAGSRGVIAGRGTLPDQHTAKILKLFLAGFIERGLSADKALHVAKMQYRQAHPDLDPFAWNGLVYYGDPDVRYSVRQSDSLTGSQRQSPRVHTGTGQ